MIIEVATVMKRTHRAVDRYLIVVCRLEALGLGPKTDGTAAFRTMQISRGPTGCHASEDSTQDDRRRAHPFE